MAVIVAGPAGLDMNDLDISLLLQGTVLTQTSTAYTLDLGGGEVVTFTGAGFAYDAQGYPVGGTISGFADKYFGQSVYQASGLSVPVSTFAAWAVNGQTLQALQTVLAGSDTLTASDNPAGNKLYGLGGGDLINGGIYGDVLDGGTGDNTIFGGDGNDTLGAPDSAGSNYLRGGAGNDAIYGGAGYDNVNGNQGADSIDGGSGGNDWLLGGQGNDVIIAHAGNTIINGNLGDDTVTGGIGADSLRGGQGNDILSGGLGDDHFYGDRGNDTITGGQGADTFHFATFGGLDRVTDFNAAQGDRVQIDGGVTYTVNQAGSDTVIDLGNGDQMTLVGVQSSSLPAGWIISA